MARCEDFPCCGHELGCCPDYDEETGEQLNMVCTCGAKLPVNARFSICDGCLQRGDSDDPDSGYWDDRDPPEDEPDVCPECEQCDGEHAEGCTMADPDAYGEDEHHVPEDAAIEAGEE